jgi:homoserine O-acetyltransferase
MRLRLLLLAAAGMFTVTGQDRQFAELGDFRLTSGEVIRNCRIGYRTVGKLNPSKSNAVLFPTWFTGTSADLVNQVGPGKLVDADGLFVILVDAIGDGVSSGPSNSTAQPHLKFPKFTIADMVESQHRLVTEKLGIAHLRGVMGISMGGMQTFRWAVQYPEFMDVAIPIVGSPLMTPMDVLLWTAELRAIEEDVEWMKGEYKRQPAMKALSLIHTFALTTPQNRVETTKDIPEMIKTSEESRKFDANDWYRQLQAMVSQNAMQPEKVKARMLIVVATQDHMVNPTTAIQFAHAVNAQLLQLDSDCGHLAPGCETAAIAPAIAQMLR